MKAFKRVLITVLVSGLLLLPVIQVIAKEQTLTTSIQIRILQRPEILKQNTDAIDCFNSQIEKNPRSALEVNSEQILREKQENTIYTICDKL